MRFSRGKGVSTALATMAVIVILVLGMSWMAYMTVLNAVQNARAAAQAETAAIKAKELVRVYIWLDPVRQPDGRYLNQTRISFVGAWSGETTINGLLVVYTDGRSELKTVTIKLGAGEDKTYLPSQLGIQGMDRYEDARAGLKYVQAHTGLGNDFVSLWGRPDRPALYVTGTTRTDTYTVTRTTTSITATTTTRTTTTTSYTATRTATVTLDPPPAGTPSLTWRITEDYCTYISVWFSFNPNGWGTPPYTITGTWTAANRWSFQLAQGSIGPYTTSSAYSWRVGMSSSPDPASYGWTIRVMDSTGRVAIWNGGHGVHCEYPPPPPPPGGGGGGGAGPTTTTTTQQPGPTTYVFTVTETRTEFQYPPGTTVTVTHTYRHWFGTTTTSTTVSTITNVNFVTSTFSQVCTKQYLDFHYAVQWYAECKNAASQDPQPSITLVRPAQLRLSMNVPVQSILLLAVLGMLDTSSKRVSKRMWVLAMLALLVTLILNTHLATPALAQVYYSTTTVTVTSTYTAPGGTYTVTTTVTTSTTYTMTDIVRTTVYTTTTSTLTDYRCTTTVTDTVQVCYCHKPFQCVWDCPDNWVEQGP